LVAVSIFYMHVTCLVVNFTFVKFFKNYFY
jgi:hypothetical protein